MSQQNRAPLSTTELSSGNGGRTSKNSSPTRLSRTNSNIEQGTSAVQKSSQDSSTQPTNFGNTLVPSTTAGQRALSATKSAPAAGDGATDNTKDKSQKSGQSTPSWPTSPRLKSPPPSMFRTISGRRLENEGIPPNSLAKKLAPVSAPELGAAMQVPQDSQKEQSTNQPNVRIPGRSGNSQGTGLETVAESSVPSTPSIGPVMKNNETSKIHVSSLEQPSNSTTEFSTNKDGTGLGVNEHVSRLFPDKAETAPSSRATSTSRPAANLAKRSITSLTGKTRAGVEPLRSMTVETEPVTSTPQLPTDRGREGGSVRTKPSTETIRPKKEKRKVSRKTPSLHAGMNSSKADIFEAKVASAVDEADSSDSDETFVYESNPPEPRPNRHHSRTPSANSLASQLDHHGVRGKHGARSGTQVAGGKKNTKFSNSLYGNQLDPESAMDGRSSTRTVGSTPRHHHIGRHGRNGHGSIADNDAALGQAGWSNASPRTTASRLSRPNSPRTSNSRYFSRKSVVAGYDAYDDGADDERLPLMGSVRVGRNRHSRRANSGYFRAVEFTENSGSNWWSRINSCFFMGFLFILSCIGMALFILALNRQLADVEIKRIEHVLASEQELMLDLHVRATNLNLFAITVNDLDVNLFAESAYVGLSSEWEKNSRSTRSSFAERRQSNKIEIRRIPFWFPPFHYGDGVDEGTDPIDDPELGTQKMLLGRIFQFDSPLIFEPSPIRRIESSSVGEIRLTKPGNKTEIGGSARWERVLQHPFDLIVRGVIRYQLPLTSSRRSAKISGRITVAPGGDDSLDHIRSLLLSHDNSRDI